MSNNTLQEQRNLDVIRRHIFELWQDGKTEVAEQLFAADFVDHNPLPGESGHLASYLKGVQFMQAGFSEQRYEVVHLMASGDRVVDHWILRAKHTGMFGDLAPTGRAIEFHGMDIFQLVDGKIAATWHVEQLLRLNEQLGLT